MSILSNINSNHLYFTLKNIIEKKLGTFPEIGIIAGQSVASALLEEFKLNQGLEMPFNDIDLFINESDAPYCEEIDLDKPEFDEDGNIILYETIRSKLVKSGEKGSLNFHSVYNSYSCELFDPTHKNGYKIVYSHRDPSNENLNYVRVDMMDTRKEGSMSALPFMLGRGTHILNGFDINACQIALDTAQQKVVWTDEFEEFINTLELKASFLGTPMHTAVRLLKKKDEIPFLNFNEEHEMLRLQSARKVFINMENQRETIDGAGYGFMPGNLFSNAYLSKIDKYWQALSKYFKLTRKMCTFNNAYSIKKPNSSYVDYKTEKVERLFYAFTPLNYDHNSVSSFSRAFIRGEQRPSCEDVNRLFSIWFNASQRSSEITEQAVVIPLNTNEAMFIPMWLRININDDFKGIEAVEYHEYQQAFKTYSQNQQLFNRFVTDKESMATIIKRAAHIEWAKNSGFNYYLAIFSSPSTFYLMPSKAEMPYRSAKTDNKSITLFEEAIKNHYVSFDEENFKALLHKAQTEFLSALNKLQSPFIECNDLKASQFSTELVDVDFIGNLKELFISLVKDNDFKNNQYFCWDSTSWDSMFFFLLGRKVFMKFHETTGMENTVLFSLPTENNKGNLFKYALENLSDHTPRQHKMESVLMKRNNLSPVLFDKCSETFDYFIN